MITSISSLYLFVKKIFTMKKVKFVATFMLCVLLAFGALVIQNIQSVRAEKICSNKSIYGAYAVQGERAYK